MSHINIRNARGLARSSFLKLAAECSSPEDIKTRLCKEAPALEVSKQGAHVLYALKDGETVVTFLATRMAPPPHRFLALTRITERLIGAYHRYGG